MTTLFISHGAPTLAIESGETGKLLSTLGVTLPRPDAILVVSAHWDTPTAKVSNAIKPETIHDFGGFPKAMYDIQYPANGSPMLADKTARLLENAGIVIQQESRGLDHGAWVPLKLMFPDADIPVVQLSIQSQPSKNLTNQNLAEQRLQAPSAHYALGRTISALQNDNIMIICSGAITHNLQDFFSTKIDVEALDYVAKFADWMGERIALNDIDSLINYRTQSQFGQQAHPSEDHILPLFVALGAAKGKPIRYQPEITYGILAMDTYVWS
ncbi:MULTISPECIES: DODA-type extradiol aromatic ring-opening family dioxygenase [Methylotenera]|uniref:DODA-type extradiol aromatic ring-opening family dioxygenase n=1 Tax=Methylotenera TaxID=359407 RepID=UPI0003754C1D|nr:MULTISPECIES: class III extradiol ring-cleavage dioxygenase [Methylotenera]